MCVLMSLQRLAETLLILTRSEQDMIKYTVYVYWSSSKDPVILVRF